MKINSAKVKEIMKSLGVDLCGIASLDRDVELKDVKFVGGNVVRYQREQTKLRWKKLKEVLTEDDVLGNKSVEYFQEKWNSLMEKYK